MQLKSFYVFYCLVAITVVTSLYSLNVDVDIMIYSVVIFYIMMLYFLYKAEGYFSLTLLFSITYGVFLLGRHISYVLAAGDLDVYVVGFLSKSVLSSSEFVYWSCLAFNSLLIFTVSSIVLKLIFGSDYHPCEKAELTYKGKMPVLLLVIIFFVIVSTTAVFVEILGYIVSYGYVGIYIYNAKMASDPTIISKLYYYSGFFIYILFGYSYVYRREKREVSLLIFLIVIKSIIFVFIGQRAPFICTMLFLIFLYTKGRVNNILKVSSFFIGLAFLSQVINYMRGTGQELNDFLTVLSRFFYEQGISFYIPYLSSEYSFPDLASVQTLLPGSKFFYDLFSGTDSNIWSYNYAHALTYYENPTAYEQGAGLGWSILSDFQQILKSDFGILFGMAILGVGCGYMESNKASDNAKFILYSIVIPFLFLPRASLASITPILLCCSFIVFARLVSKNNHSEKNSGKLS